MLGEHQNDYTTVTVSDLSKLKDFKDGRLYCRCFQASDPESVLDSDITWWIEVYCSHKLKKKG